ncbi:MAG: copper resistance CopC family protein [Mycobacterium sp.]
MSRVFGAAAKVALAMLILLAGVGSALAHAHLSRSEPVGGRMLHAAPREVRIWFSEALEPKVSSIEVLNARGERVSLGDAEVDADDPTQLFVKLAPIGPGSYRVRWRATSADTHVTRGAFMFAIGP